MASHLLALVSPRSHGRQRARGSRRFPAVAFVGALLIGVLAPAAQAGAVLADSSVAPDGPGALSHFDLARKDCLGTARTTTSKVWYTVERICTAVLFRYCERDCPSTPAPFD